MLPFWHLVLLSTTLPPLLTLQLKPLHLVLVFLSLLYLSPTTLLPPPSICFQQGSAQSAPALSDDRPLPFFRLTARARQADIDTSIACADCTYVADFKRHYVTLNGKMVEYITSMPFPSSMLPGDAYQQLTRTVSRYDRRFRLILLMLCEDEPICLSASEFVPRWKRPLQNKMPSTTAPDKPTTADLVLSIGCFAAG